MFGLTFEKLFLAAIIAAVLIGPHRLPQYASRFAATVRNLRATVDAARVKAEAESGVTFARSDWQSLDPRKYDPRRIIRDAWDAPAVEEQPADPAPVAQSEEPASTEGPPAGHWTVEGSSAHPRRVWIPDYESA